MEFTHFSEFSFNYVRTRMRSDSKYQSFIRCGLNPHPTHFVHKYLDMFIDQDSGFAIKEFSGRTAYYIVDKGQTITSWSKEDLLERYPSLSPRKYSFIPSSLEDNKHMLSKNEGYRQDLEANDPANAAMLLSGNWKYTPAANGIFDRSTVCPEQMVDKEPDGCVYFRAYDKASSVPVTEGGDSKTLDPDYTCSITLAKDRNNNVYVRGDYIRDPATQEQLARYRKKPGPRDELILQQGLYDQELRGSKTYIVLPQDPGQAGASEVQQASVKLQKEGVLVKKDPSHGNKSKAVRFEPFCVACHTGNVYWVKSSFDTATWDYMLLELENFNPIVKNNGFHDDLVDTFSSAWAMCISSRVHRPMRQPTNNSTTSLSEYKKTVR